MTRVQPVLGDRAKLALKVSADWDADDRPLRKLLVLLAAFADARERQSFARDLCQRLDLEMEEFDLMLGKLAWRGFIWTVRRDQQRSVYCLIFAGDKVPERDRKRYEVFERQRQDERERVPA